MISSSRTSGKQMLFVQTDESIQGGSATADRLRALGDRFQDRALWGKRTKGDKDTLTPWFKWHEKNMGTVTTSEAELWESMGAQKDAKEASTKQSRAERFRWIRAAADKPVRVGGKEAVKKADAEQMAKDFGLTNVQFGKWVSDEDAEHHLKACHGAMYDLADMLGMDAKDVSLNGRLALGMGARGQGGARAHYEAAGMIINLTKFAGGGSLAHEWGHFLDNVIAKNLDLRSTKADTMCSVADTASQSRRWNVEVDPNGPYGQAGEEIAKAVEKAMRVIRTGTGNVTKTILVAVEDENEPKGYRYEKRERTYVSRSSEFLAHQEALGEYWARPHEMFARAFESWLEDKLHSQGRQSTYLVSGTKNQYVTGKPVASRQSDETKDERRLRREAHEAELLRTFPELQQAYDETQAAKAEKTRAEEQWVEIQMASGRRRNQWRAIEASWTTPDLQQERDALRITARHYSEMLKTALELKPYPEVEADVAEAAHAQPYPQGEERKLINAAMEELFGTLRKHGVLKKAFSGPWVELVESVRLRKRRNG